MRTKLITVIPVVLLFAVLSGCRSKQLNSPLDAAQLTHRYYLYENRSDRWYYNRELEVKGILSQVTRDKDNRLAVILARKNAPYGVKCIFNKEESKQNIPLELNSMVSVKGICQGLEEHVILTDCRFTDR